MFGLGFGSFFGGFDNPIKMGGMLGGIGLKPTAETIKMMPVNAPDTKPVTVSTPASAPPTSGPAASTPPASAPAAVAPASSPATAPPASAPPPAGESSGDWANTSRQRGLQNEMVQRPYMGSQDDQAMMRAIQQDSASGGKPASTAIPPPAPADAPTAATPAPAASTGAPATSDDAYFSNPYRISSADDVPGIGSQETMQPIRVASADNAFVPQAKLASARRSDINNLIHAEAARTGINPDMLGAFVNIESGGNPFASTGSYKGLMQLSRDEFARHGGRGDIFDPAENLRAGANALVTKSAAFQKEFGRQPSATEVYLMHQQGEAGLRAHLSNPDRPAWMNMRSTGEGQQKGDNWAKKAIWGNIPESAKRQFGSVDDVTSKAFMGLWDARVARGVGGGGGGGAQANAASGGSRNRFVDAAREGPTTLPTGSRPQDEINPTTGTMWTAAEIIRGQDKAPREEPGIRTAEKKQFKNPIAPGLGGGAKAEKVERAAMTPAKAPDTDMDEVEVSFAPLPMPYA